MPIREILAAFYFIGIKSGFFIYAKCFPQSL